MKILQDDREPDLSLTAALVDEKIILERTRLKIGDYEFGNFIIERKTIDDFCSSILDKRLENQIKNMKESGKDSIIIIIGSISSRTANIHENCILGKICSIVYKYKIPVIMVEDEYQFMYCLKNLYQKSTIQ